ncbi:CDP-glycerol glycerophosphotransferase family protein [Brevibacterium sediminis]|uniref:CDP-glycerol glycerophosphotransferase family protein n=1 Tax=Brevibacterium TaxID=1696 RepID=UPI001E3DF869|nr:CDP-glycerol glycerophosphotransferase family protein [Brevibacterium sediminis]
MELRNLFARSAIRVLGTARRTLKKATRTSARTPASGPVNSAGLASLDLVQAQNLLHIDLAPASPVVPSGLWVEHDEDLHRIGSLEEVDSDADDSGGAAVRTATIDLDSLIENLSDWTSPPPPGADGDETAGFVLRLYVEYADYDVDEMPSSTLETSNDGTTVALVRLGRATSTRTENLAYRRVGYRDCYPLVNRNGHIAIEVDRPHRPFADVRNEGLTIRDGRLEIEGRVIARGTEYSDATLVVVGRTSGFRATADVELAPNDELSERRFGLNYYRFSAALDFNDLVDEISDDNADLYLDLAPVLGDEPKRARIGKSRYLVRFGTTGSTVSSGNKTVSIIPYYTFKAKYPSLHLETFNASAFDYMHRLVANRRSWNPPKSSDRKPVWLIGELPYKAQDNGLQFFRYMRDEHPEVDAYYVIEPDSPERVNLDGYDNVIDFRSHDHIQVALAADKIIGTHHPDFLYPTREPQFERALRADKVFLQHGVTAAKWMVPNYGRYVRGFDVDLITVCSEREKEFFVKDFGYAPEQVAVTGFARFDALLADDVDVNPDQLMIMPTWRPWLQDPERFVESDYFQRWKSLLTSDRLRALIEKYDLTPIFCLHPNMQQFSSHFDGLGIRIVVQGEIDVQLLLKQSSMLVTDYSSVAFDFAFLHKPVVYYQFDDHRFAQPHADPVAEFPGPVVAEEARVLDAVESAYESGGAMAPDFRRRADRFLAHRDTSSRERIFEAIQNSTKPDITMADRVQSETAQSVYRVARRNRYYLPVMKRLYKLMRLAPLDEQTIVFETGQGKQYADSPRAIHEELIRQGDTRRKVWIYHKRLPVTDQHTTVVKRHSPAFFWHLATAKYWINNHNFPNYIHRRDQGVYIQTWHGTPLKRMFLDQDNFYGRDPGYVDRVKEASAQWNALVSPSPYATKAMRSSYGYTGEVYELGYPRNDVLRGPDTDEIRAGVRRRLSIPRERTVVLYAPTFRDDQPTTRGRFAFQWPFDPQDFVERFGDDVTLLVRTHFLINTKLEIPEELKAHIIDVSGFPDINELFLASDMLVTDYSSSFFDYSVLERPIIFFAYDLENYRDNLRGFYLDYETELPGPVATTSAALFAEIDRASSVTEEDRERLRSFAKQYAPNDDGHAAARVIDQLL